MRFLGLSCFVLSAVVACGARSGLLSDSLQGPLARAGAGGTAGGSGFTGGGLGGLSGTGETSGAGSGAGGASGGSSGHAGSASGGTAAVTGDAGDAGEAGATSCPIDGMACDDANPCTLKDHCEGGACTGTPLACTNPPAAACVDAHTLRRYSSGACALGACVYQATDSACLAGCASGACAPFAASISVGESDACATVNHGPLKCWGGTFGGVIGDINALRVPPTVVPGLENGVSMVSVGTTDACALTDAGAVVCWGGYSRGVVTVSGLPTDVTSVACGAPYFDHTCVLSPTQGVKCWGSNNFGQLGNGTTTPSFTYQYAVVDVTGLPSGVTSISAGSNDTCAIVGGGQLWCWGMGRYGELGNGAFDNSSVPVQVSGLSAGTLAVSAGEEYSCAITPQRTVECWGWDADGTQNVALPLTIAGVSQATALSVDGAACAITSTGALKCWGDGAFGQLGNGQNNSSYTVAVDPIGMSTGIVAVGVGEYGTCAVLETGGVRCWGGSPAIGGLIPQDVAGF